MSTFKLHKSRTKPCAAKLRNSYCLLASLVGASLRFLLDRYDDPILMANRLQEYIRLVERSSKKSGNELGLHHSMHDAR